MNRRVAIVLAALSVIMIWGANFAQCGDIQLLEDEPRCRIELVDDEVHGVRKIEVCKD